MAGDPKKTPPGRDKSGGGKSGRDRRRQRDTGTLVAERTKKPRRYKVVLHNDNFTPMEFVVMVLEKIFRRTKAEATRIMLTVHNEGAGIAGTYTREVAETKAASTVKLARSEGYPLLLTTEPE
jgi:ATP-dependent Clp protease adaptor protein ClpS